MSLLKLIKNRMNETEGQESLEKIPYEELYLLAKGALRKEDIHVLCHVKDINIIVLTDHGLESILKSMEYEIKMREESKEKEKISKPKTAIRQIYDKLEGYHD